MKAITKIVLGMGTGLLVFGITESLKLINAAQTLDVNPGKIKLGVPFTRIEAETQKRNTLIPLSVTALMTNKTGTPLTFGQPHAPIFYEGKKIAETEVSNKVHTLAPNATDYALELKYEVNILSFAETIKDAAKYFAQRITGKMPANRKIDIKLSVPAYGMTFNENLQYFI